MTITLELDNDAQAKLVLRCLRQQRARDKANGERSSQGGHDKGAQGAFERMAIADTLIHRLQLARGIVFINDNVTVTHKFFVALPVAQATDSLGGTAGNPMKRKRTRRP